MPSSALGADVAPSHDDAGKKEQGGGEGGFSFEKLHVLVVDDSAVNRRLLSKALTSLGAAVTEAENGIEAVALVAQSFVEYQEDVSPSLVRDKPLESRSEDDVLPGCAAADDDHGNTKDRRLPKIKVAKRAGNDGVHQAGGVGNDIDGGDEGEADEKPERTSTSSDEKEKGGGVASTSTSSKNKEVNKPGGRSSSERSKRSSSGEDNGFGVVKTQAGATVNSTARIRKFDIILCDSIMPEMNGPDAVRKIREMGFTQPIIGITGNAQEEDIREFMDHGVDKVCKHIGCDSHCNVFATS
jgi:CheY-like chemotaxis protein